MKILVIEDNKRLRALVVEQLMKSGFVVDGVGSGENGISALATSSYDVLLLDLGLGNGGDPALAHRPVMSRPLGSSACRCCALLAACPAYYATTKFAGDPSSRFNSVISARIASNR